MNKKRSYIDKTDEELFFLIKVEHDEEAFDALYRRYDKRLYAYCLSVLRNKEAAEDVFQTVVMTMYEKRDLFKGGNFSAWLFTIARHFSIKASRKMSRMTSLEDVSIEEALEQNDEDVLLNEALNKAVQELPENYRKPLELRYFGGFSYEQIASTLGIGLSSAKMRVSRARKMLQKFLSPLMNEMR